MCDFSTPYLTDPLQSYWLHFVYFLPEKIVRFAKRERKSKLFVKINSDFFPLKLKKLIDISWFDPKKFEFVLKKTLILSSCCVDRTFFLGTKIVFCTILTCGEVKKPFTFLYKTTILVLLVSMASQAMYHLDFLRNHLKNVFVHIFVLHNRKKICFLWIKRSCRYSHHISFVIHAQYIYISYSCGFK